MKKIFFLCLLLSTLTQAFGAECDYELYLPYAAVQLTDTQQVVQLDVGVMRDKSSSSARCKSYQIYFGKGLSNSYQRKAFSLSANSLNYNLHKLINLNGILKEQGDALNANEYVFGTTDQHDSTYNQRIFISVPGLEAQNYPKSGTYYDIVQVAIYANESNSGNFRLQATGNLYVGLIVNKKIDISLIDEGGVFDPSATSKVLDFGILSQGSEKGADLRVVSNTSYQVKVSSANNGNLRLSNSSVAYSMRSNGSLVSLALSSGLPTLIGSGDATDAAGDKYNLRFQVTGSTANLTPGIYNDTITVTAIAN